MVSRSLSLFLALVLCVSVSLSVSANGAFAPFSTPTYIAPSFNYDVNSFSYATSQMDTLMMEPTVDNTTINYSLTVCVAVPFMPPSTTYTAVILTGQNNQTTYLIPLSYQTKTGNLCFEQNKYGHSFYTLDAHYDTTILLYTNLTNSRIIPDGTQPYTSTTLRGSYRNMFDIVVAELLTPTFWCTNSIQYSYAFILQDATTGALYNTTFARFQGWNAQATSEVSTPHHVTAASAHAHGSIGPIPMCEVVQGYSGVVNIVHYPQPKRLYFTYQMSFAVRPPLGYPVTPLPYSHFKLLEVQVSLSDIFQITREAPAPVATILPNSPTHAPIEVYRLATTSKYALSYEDANHQQQNIPLTGSNCLDLPFFDNPKPSTNQTHSVTSPSASAAVSSTPTVMMTKDDAGYPTLTLHLQRFDPSLLRSQGLFGSADASNNPNHYSNVSLICGNLYLWDPLSYSHRSPVDSITQYDPNTQTAIATCKFPLPFNTDSNYSSEVDNSYCQQDLRNALLSVFVVVTTTTITPTGAKSVKESLNPLYALDMQASYVPMSLEYDFPNGGNGGGGNGGGGSGGGSGGNGGNGNQGDDNGRWIDSQSHRILLGCVIGIPLALLIVFFIIRHKNKKNKPANIPLAQHPVNAHQQLLIDGHSDNPYGHNPYNRI